MALSKRQSKALEGSIEKWEEIAGGEGVDNGGTNCPLCKLYGGFFGCSESCPVMGYSTKSSCKDTPYIEWKKHLTSFHDDHGYPVSRIKGCSTCTRLARKELNFLKGLRD